MAERGRSLKNLITFHTDNKLLVLSHSPGHCATLEKLVVEAKEMRKGELYARYLAILMEGLGQPAPRKKNTSGYRYIPEYFKQY